MKPPTVDLEREQTYEDWIVDDWKKVIESSGLILSLLLRRLERNDLQKFIWDAENSLRAVEHMDTVSSECLEND
ncbi:hypothetical protein TNCV_3875471 [Trichonephila clavipes]|uniref:Uncharacterized protein n=1 Tax=Trichonephila clavipes TaxID=2585209 RepID=A0A8X6VMG3_TRICX|nr:hypothetical protein TNCV_3875471 [Trichonephila clavipes]